MKKIIGFTGTKDGMTFAQKELVRKILSKDACGFHHGDCVGADAEAHVIADSLGIPICIHPPTNGVLRAFCKNDTVLTPKPYLDRNHDIVDASELMIATPKEREEQLRSGTWATIRYARRIMKPLILILPHGAFLQR